MKTEIKITINSNVYEVKSTYEMDTPKIIDLIKECVQSEILIIKTK
jgi:hypothetical protein